MVGHSQLKADRVGELPAVMARQSKRKYEQKAERADEAPAAMVRDSQLKAERVGELPAAVSRHSALQAK